MIASLVLSCAPVLQSPFNQLRTVSEPAYGIASTISADDNTLYWMQGNQLQHIDLNVVRSNELNDQAADPLVSSATLDTGCSALLEDPDGQRLFIGAADFGLYVQDLSIAGGTTPTLIDPNTGGRWIHDMVVDASGNYLLAVFGGLDASQLRVYDISTTPTLVNTLDIDTAHGLLRPGIGYAVDVHGPYAYLAMGRSGLARIRWNAAAPVLQQGYDPVPSIHANTPGRSVVFRTRDLDIEGDFLFAASNAGGVIRVDLSVAGWPTGANATIVTPILGSMPGSSDHFPVRVAATYNAIEDETYLAVGTYHNPDASHEWGPFNPSATYGQGLGNPFVEPDFVGVDGAIAVGEDEALFLFSQSTGGPLVQRSARFVQGDHELRDWKTIAIQYVPSTNRRVWIYDGDFYAWNSRRQSSGAFTPLMQSADDKYVEFEPTYTSGLVSKLDPNIILSGADGLANSIPLYRVEDSATTGQPEFSRLPGTTDLPHRLSLLVRDSWVEEGAVEWVPGGQSDATATVGSLQSWKFVALTTGAGNFTSWKENYLDFPDDPADPMGSNGRSYAAVAVDDRPGSELLACGRSQVRYAVALYMRSAVRDAMMAVPAGAHVAVPPLAVLDLTPELGGMNPASNHHNLRMDFINLPTGDVTQRFLMVAAGAGQNQASIAGQGGKPKLVFFNVTDCTSPGNCDPTSIGPPISAFGTGDSALSFGATVAGIGNTVYAFMGDALGHVTAFDLTPLAGGNSPNFAGTYFVGASILDGLSAPVTDVVARRELVDGVVRLVLYLAASREGIVRLLVTETGAGTVNMTELLPRINTPGQVSTLSIGSMAIGGVPTEAMIAFDHDHYGIQLYTEQ